MSYTINDLEPFTYYRNPESTRGFLLVDYGGPEYGNYAKLIEIGKSRDFGIRQDLTSFLNLITNKQLIKFIPKIK